MDENTKYQIYILILGVLIGASGYLANSLFLWNTSVNKDKSEIAEGLYIDILMLENYIVDADRELFMNPQDSYIFVHGTPLYPEKGLYFAYQRDIFRMDRKVAQDTFMFYNHLLSAERDRELIFDIQRQGDVRDLTLAELNRQQVLTRSVAREINMSVDLLYDLKLALYSAT